MAFFSLGRVLGCFGVLWGVSGCFGALWAVSGCFGLLWAAVGCYFLHEANAFFSQRLDSKTMQSYDTISGAWQPHCNQITPITH